MRDTARKPSLVAFWSQDTVVVASRDLLTKTKKGMLRSSSGTVTYSNVHANKAGLSERSELQLPCRWSWMLRSWCRSWATACQAPSFEEALKPLQSL